MNFRLTMVMVIVLALVCSLFVWFHNRPEPKPEDAATKNALLSPQPKDITAISYTQEGDKQVAFAKSGATWTMTYPTTAPANLYDVNSIADSLKGLTYKEKFEPEASGVHSADATGVAKPRNVVSFADDGKKEHTLNFGKATIGGIYATLDGGATIYLVDNNALDALQKDPQSFRDKKIHDVGAGEVTGLTIKHADQTVSLAKSGDKWLIDAPIAGRANRTVVDDIVNQMKSIQASGFSDLAKTMPATGLHPPVVTVTALVEEKPAAPASPTTVPASTSQPAATKTPVTLELGYYTDLTKKDNVYASLAGSNDVFTLPADALTKLNRQLKDLRDPAITPVAVSSATEVSITSTVADAAQHNVVLKNENGKWMVTNLHRPVTAGTPEVTALLSDIANLRAIKFVDNAGDLKSIGLDPPQTTISLTIPGQSQHEVLLIGKPETADKVTPIMRQGEPTVYLVQSAEIDKVTPPWISMRDKTVDRLIVNNMRSLAITGPAAPTGGTTLERDGSGWKVTQNGKSDKADDTKVTTLLAEFSPLTASRYVAEYTPGESRLPATPDVTVTLTTLDASPTTAPATLLGGLKGGAAGPNPAAPVLHTLRLYKPAAGKGWQALWEGGSDSSWIFEPTPALVEHLTTTTYAAAPAPAAPAAEPAK